MDSAPALLATTNSSAGIPLKLTFTRGDAVVERRRIRLYAPTMRDVVSVAERWGRLNRPTLKYTDDEGDAVTMDTDEEWAECLSLWSERGEATRPVAVTVELSTRRYRCWSPPAAARAEAGCPGCSFAVTGTHPTHCCRWCSREPGQHGRRCAAVVHVPSVAKEDSGTDSDAAAGAAAESDEGAQVAEKCPGCEFTRTGVHATHCCKKCSKKPGQHGKRCAGAFALHVPAVVKDDSGTESDAAPVAVAEKCPGCEFMRTGVHATHCCKKCSKKPGQHGKRCLRRDTNGDVTTDVVESSSSAEEASDAIVPVPEPEQAEAEAEAEVEAEADAAPGAAEVEEAPAGSSECASEPTTVVEAAVETETDEEAVLVEAVVESAADGVPVEAVPVEARVVGDPNVQTLMEVMGLGEEEAIQVLAACSGNLQEAVSALLER